MSERYNIKFSNVNLLDVMGCVVEDFTLFYKSDFDVDINTLRNATITPIEQDKTFIWLCRSMGTWLLRERDVFVTDTHEHRTFCFYREQMNEPILAFAVEVKCMAMDTVIGNLYAMDYDKLYDHVKTVCLPSVSVLMRYERGELVKPVSRFDGYPDNTFGELKSYQFFPEDEGRLRSVLREEKRRRTQFAEGNVADYLAQLK